MIDLVHLPYPSRDKRPVICYPMPTDKLVDQEQSLTDMGLDSSATNLRPRAMYIHIPFCEHLCGFCPFVKYSADEGRIESYVQDLVREIKFYGDTEMLRSGGEVGSIYFGGGTGSILTPRQVDLALDAVRTHHRTASDIEITLESSPITVDSDKLKAVAQSGVNRISFGVQTLDADLSRDIDVAQDATKSIAAIQDAQRAGIDNVSIDLMYNLPGQSDEVLREDVRRSSELGVGQVTLFPLAVVPGTKLSRDINAGLLSTVGSTRREVELALVAKEALENAGYYQRSVPDFARPGNRYRHSEIHFQELGDLIGLGAGAVVSINWYVYVKVAELQRYASLAGQGPACNTGVRASQDERLRGALVMGLRLLRTKNDLFRAEDEAGRNPREVFPEILEDLEERGLIESDDDEVRLTETGAMFGYDVAKEFYSEEIREQGQRLAERLSRLKDVESPLRPEHP